MWGSGMHGARHRYVLIAMVATLVACEGLTLRTVHRIHFVRTLFSNRDHVAVFRNMRSLFAVHDIPASSVPLALATAARARELPATFQFEGATLDTATFLATTDTTGLIIIKNDAVVYEQYWRGNDAHTRCIGWSVSSPSSPP